jgi:hypothetical protein
MATNKGRKCPKCYKSSHIIQETDSLKEYRDKEPMTPAKEREHEPTAVKREMTEII